MDPDVPILNVPVSPHVGTYLGVDNVVLGLAGVAPAPFITLPGRPDATATYTLLDFLTVHTDLSMAASLGFGDIMSAKASAQSQYFLLDLVMSHVMTYPASTTNIIAKATFGVGFRIVISTFKMDASFTASAAGIAAAATAKLGSASYEIQVAGGGLGALGATQPLLSNLCGEFNLETLSKVWLVRDALLEYYKLNAANMVPELLSVEIRPSVLASALSNGLTNDFQSLMLHQVYAVNRCIGSRRSANQAITDITRDPHASSLTPALVTDFYTRVLGLGPDQDPGDDSTIWQNIGHVFNTNSNG